MEFLNSMATYHQKSSKLRDSAQVILPTCSMKPASSSALLADSSWFFVDKEGSTYTIRFVLFLPMIKRRRFHLPSFEIFAEVHSQQTSPLSASTIIIGLQIFFFPHSPLPPLIKTETVDFYQSSWRNVAERKNLSLHNSNIDESRPKMPFCISKNTQSPCLKSRLAPSRSSKFSNKI